MKRIYHIGNEVRNGNKYLDAFLDDWGVNADEIEIFGASVYDEFEEVEKMNLHFVNYGSRDTEIIIEDGEVIWEQEEIEKWENEHCC